MGNARQASKRTRSKTKLKRWAQAQERERKAVEKQPQEPIKRDGDRA